MHAGAPALTIGNTSSFCNTKARATERLGAVNDAALPQGTHASHIEHAWRAAHTCDPSGRRDHSRIVATIGHSVWHGRHLLGGAALFRVSDGPAASRRARRGRLTPALGLGDFSSGFTVAESSRPLQVAPLVLAVASAPVTSTANIPGAAPIAGARCRCKSRPGHRELESGHRLSSVRRRPGNDEVRPQNREPVRREPASVESCSHSC